MTVGWRRRGADRRRWGAAAAVTLTTDRCEPPASVAVETNVRPDRPAAAAVQRRARAATAAARGVFSVESAEIVLSGERNFILFYLVFWS
jgi:hypothetical protein